jgi:hypothetical protein
MFFGLWWVASSLLPPLHGSKHINAYATTWHKSTSGNYSTTEPGTPSWFVTIQKKDKIL